MCFAAWRASEAPAHHTVCKLPCSRIEFRVFQTAEQIEGDSISLRQQRRLPSFSSSLRFCFIRCNSMLCPIGCRVGYVDLNEWLGHSSVPQCVDKHHNATLFISRHVPRDALCGPHGESQLPGRSIWTDLLDDQAPPPTAHLSSCCRHQ